MSIFSKVSMKKPKTSTFNMSYDRKFSLNMGQLVPCHIQEVVPGDKFNMTTQQMLRMAPMVSPVMHEVNVFTHFFFVPNRIMWDGWEDFITGGENGLDSTLFPTLYNLQVKTGSLADYLGLPVKNNGYPISTGVSILPFIAYQMIYNEFYRDQNLIDEVDIKSFKAGRNDAGNFPQLFEIRKRAWQHDYFTSALPWAQKGLPVKFPIAPADAYLNVFWQSNPDSAGDWVRNPDTGEIINLSGPDKYLENRNGHLNTELTSTLDAPSSIDNSQNLRVPLDNMPSPLINDVRKAFKLQEWLEKQARGGSRYVENIMSFFGVRSRDARLQRPEYLGGGMSPVMISEVLQTSQTQDSPQGNMAGHGLNLGKNHSFSKFFEEHGYIIGIMSVMPKTAYQQGVPRHFTKFDKFDYFWPQFEHIGEQPIFNKEVFLPEVDSPDYPNDGVFGYIPRYAEYKYNPSTVHGDFRTSLDFWHMGRIFDPANPPKLNKDFVECNPTKRIFAVEDSVEGTLYCHMFHTIEARRPMAYYSDPSFR